MKPVKIIDGLYLGNYQTAKNLKLLKGTNIKSIINISAGKNNFPDEFTYLNLHLIDDEKSDITSILDVALDFIAKNIKKGNILVHCKGAIHRSPSIIIAYLAKYNKMTVKSALEYVKKCRPVVKSRQNFIDGIKTYVIKK